MANPFEPKFDMAKMVAQALGVETHNGIEHSKSVEYDTSIRPVEQAYEISHECINCGQHVSYLRAGCTRCGDLALDNLMRVFPPRPEALAAAQESAKAVFVVKSYLDSLEGNEDGICDIRRKIHAPLHAALDAALEAMVNSKIESST